MLYRLDPYRKKKKENDTGTGVYTVAVLVYWKTFETSTIILSKVLRSPTIEFS